MYKVKDTIDGKYQVTAILPEQSQGGMGRICFAVNLADNSPCALKYFIRDDAESIQRFRREVRLLQKYKNSEFVVPILSFNLDHAPPYFVMEKADGDLTEMIPKLKVDPTLQEKVFLRMLDCVEHIHGNTDFHRDVKPQNFLIFGDRFVISDLGLAKDLASNTEFTRTTDTRGTAAFYPPQFAIDGFKNAERSDDIFMLGKSFYYLLTGRNPYYLMPKDVAPVVFAMIQKCCEMQRESRYQNCQELRSAIVGAYDMFLGRNSQFARFEELKKLASQESGISLLSVKDVLEFLSLLENESEDAKISFIKEMPTLFIGRICDLGIPGNRLNLILDEYWNFLKYAYSQKYYPFSHAETVADQMDIVVRAPQFEARSKANALKIAVDISVRFNRGAALKACARIIESIHSDDLALLAGDILKEYRDDYLIEEIQLADCRHAHIISVTKILLKAKGGTQ